MTNSSASLITSPLFYETDQNNNPLAGGKVYSYQAGTLTPLTTYTDATLTVPNTNPVILDEYGKAQIWLGPYTYKLNVTDVNNVQHPDYPVDNIQSIQITASNTATAAVLSQLASTASGQGAALVGDAITGGSGLTQHQINSMEVNAVKFGADPTGTNDSTSAFNYAISYLVSLGVGAGGSASMNYTGGVLKMGANGATFKILGTVLVPSGLEIDLQGCNIVGPGHATVGATFQSAYLNAGVLTTNQVGGATPWSTAQTATPASWVGALKIHNGSFSECYCALSMWGCLDNCIFETLKFYNCTYSVYAYQCFYANFRNMMTRCAGSWATSGPTNGAYHFESAINVEDIVSLFCGGRILAFEIWSSGGGACMSIRNCSAEQGVNGFYFSGVSQKVVFRDCYIEGMSGLIFDFTHQGFSTPAYILDIDDCFFNACLGTILNGIWVPNLLWGKRNQVQGAPMPASICYLSDNLNSNGEVNVQDLQTFDNTGGIGTGVIASGVMTVSGYTGNGIQVGTSFYGSNLTALVTVTSLGTGTGGNGTYNVSGMTTAASGPIGIAMMPTAPPLFTFNPAGQTTKMAVKGRSLINSYSNYNQIEAIANAPGLTNAPIPYNFFGVSGYVPGAIPFCSQFTTGSGTSRSVTIDTKIAYNLPSGNPDKYLMGIFNLTITCTDNIYPATGTLMGRFSATNAVIDTPASGYTVAVSNFNGFIRLTVTGSAFAAGAYTVAYTEGIVKILS